jgi:hypothetical protein
MRSPTEVWDCALDDGKQKNIFIVAFLLNIKVTKKQLHQNNRVGAILIP